MEKNVKYTKEMYNRYGKAYEKSMHKGRFYNKYIEIPAIKNVFGNLKGKKVLDCGCSTGIHSQIMFNLGAKVTGIDVSKTMIESAKKNVPSADFRVADMQNLPFKNNSFDLVFYGLSIHYVKDISKVFKEANRVLKHGGRIIVSTHHPLPGSLKRTKIRGKKEYVFRNYFRTNLVKWEMLPGMELKTYDRTFADLINPLTESGFCIIKVLEPIPIKEGARADPHEYAKTSKKPAFLVIEARKH